MRLSTAPSLRPSSRAIPAGGVASSCSSRRRWSSSERQWACVREPGGGTERSRTPVRNVFVHDAVISPRRSRASVTVPSRSVPQRSPSASIWCTDAFDPRNPTTRSNRSSTTTDHCSCLISDCVRMGVSMRQDATSRCHSNGWSSPCPRRRTGNVAPVPSRPVTGPPSGCDVSGDRRRAEPTGFGLFCVLGLVVLGAELTIVWSPRREMSTRAPHGRPVPTGTIPRSPRCHWSPTAPASARDGPAPGSARCRC